ncbi:unnamed protein product [Effrenium voratum]|nr:unnamed protein product [Effrenium voratum]
MLSIFRRPSFSARSGLKRSALRMVRKAGRKARRESVWRPVAAGKRWGNLELRETPGGLGWVATCALKENEVLEPGEAPLACWSTPPGAASVEARAAAAARAFLLLPGGCRRRRAWLRLFGAEEQSLAAAALRGAGRVALDAEAEEAAKAAAIAHLNAFCTLEGGLAIYEKCSRFNHSCAPNAEYGLAAGLMKVRTLREVQPGEEVCFSYLGSCLMSRGPRQQLLRSRYLFTCGCALCSSPVDELAGWACCGRRVLQQCCCGQRLDDKAVEQLERAVEGLEGDVSGFLEELLERSRTLRLDFHVVTARIHLLSLESRVERQDSLEEAWGNLAFLRGWFLADWNPLSHCFLMHLFEPMLQMLEYLERSKRPPLPAAGTLPALSGEKKDIKASEEEVKALPLAAAGLAAVAFVGPVARSAPAPRVALRGAREVPETQDGEQSPLRVGGALLSMMAAFALALLPVQEAHAAKSGGRIGGSASAARARPPPARAPAAASSSRTTVINKTTVIAPPPVMAPAPVAIGMAPVVVAPAPSLGDVVVGSVIGGAINNAMYGGHHSSGPSTSDRMLENQQRQDERQMDKQSMEIEQLKSELANLKK